MATSAKRGMPAWEQSGKDKDSKAVTKKYGKEGSAKEEAYDKKQMMKTAGGGKGKGPQPFIGAKVFGKK